MARGLDGVEITVAVFLQAPRDEIDLGDVDEALLPVPVGSATQISPELTQHQQQEQQQ